MTREVKGGTIDVSVVIRIIDSADGTPETGVTAATGGLVLEYRRELAASVSLATIVDLAALTTAHTDKGIKHIGNGYYRLDLVDAACAAGVPGVLIHGVATGMVVIGEYITLVAFDPFDAVRLGLTAVPNAAADAAGGLPISDAGGLDLDAVGSAVTSGTHGNAALKTLIDTLDNYVNTEMAAVLAAVDTEVASILATVDSGTHGNAALKTLIDLVATYIDTEVAAVLAIVGSGTHGNAALKTLIDTLTGYVDTEVAATLAAVDTEVAAIKAKTDNLPASPAAVGSAMTLTSGERDSIGTALFDLTDALATGWTLRKALRVAMAALAGKASGLATATAVYRDILDTKDRITATVDASGNRTAVTLDGT